MKRCRPVPDLRAGIEYEQARRGREVAAELMGFTVEYDAAAACLRLGGDCRMADAPTLERELRALRNAGPSKLTVDFASAGEFDIGPAWLLQRALAECQAAGSRIESVGPTPEHAHFLQELTERDVGSMPPPEGNFPTIFTFMRDLGFDPTQRAGFIVGQEGLVLRSTDGGKRWDQVLPPESRRRAQS